MIDYNRQDRALEFLSSKKVNSKDFSNKKIAIIGCGGVGSVLCELLVRGGFTNLIVFDFDVVDKSNLQRQIFTKEDVGEFKVKSIEKRLKSIDENCNIEIVCEKVNENTLNEYTLGCDYILDASDNVDIRVLIDQFCLENKKTWIYCGAILNEVICCVIDPKNNCFSKIMNPKTPTQDCSIGVLASTTFTAASLSYNLLLKNILTGEHSKLIKYNIWNNKFFEVNL